MRRTALDKSGLLDEAFFMYGEDIDLSYRLAKTCLLYTSDAADERSSVDFGGRRIIKKKKHRKCGSNTDHSTQG